jgi:HEAT repeat protein
MTGWRNLAAFIAALALTAALAQAAEPNVQALINELKGQGEAKTRTPAELQAAYAAAIDALLPDLGSPDVGRRGNAQSTLEAISWRASRPGAPAERAAFGAALAAKLPAATAPDARVWLIRQLQWVGGAECVPALAAVLSDADAMVRDCARRALQAIPAPEAGTALSAALAKAPTPEWRVALLNAIGGRKDVAAAADVARFLANSDESVAIAAAAALGKIDGPDAIKALTAARGTAGGKLKQAVLDSYLLCADQRVAEGKKAEAFNMYRSVNDPADPARFRMAALRGLVASGGPTAVAILTDALTGKDAALRAFALSLVSDVPGPDATRAFVGLLPKLSPAEQTLLITAFGSRGDPAAKPAVLDALKSADEGVRAAAVRAIADLGGAADVPMLADMAAAAQGADKEAILQSLARLRGKDVDAAIVKIVDTAGAKGRVDLIRALAVRNAEGVQPSLVKALADADGAVRTEAAAALASLGDQMALVALAGLLAKSPSDAERDAGQKAVAAITGRTADKDACAAPVLAALAGSSPAGRVALLGVLAKTGTAKALAAARGALKDADPAVQEAALRALADWPDAAPAADLLAIATSDEKATRQVIALRGYVRLTGLASGPAAGKVAMYKEAMAAAKRPEDKKMVLAAMADSPSMATLEMARSCLADASLKAEAAAALVKIAAGVGGQNRDEAMAALQQVIQTADDNTRRQAQDAINVLEKSEDFIMVWQLAGPYTQADKDAAALFDIAFPPEQGDGSKAKWVPLPGTAIDPGMPGVIGLDKALGGENCCAYLRTGVYSPKAQDVSLEVGSDDGVKIWLNGKVVHANNVNRGLAVGQDKVKAALAQGWNTVLMKITQGGAQWAACLRVRQPNGSKLDGLRLSTEPAK